MTVAGGQIGDTIWRDWDGDGVQDAGEEGIAGVTVKLYATDGDDPAGDRRPPTPTATTIFTGLIAGTYVVKVNDGTPPAGLHPDRRSRSATACTTCDSTDSASLAANQQYLTADFGYKPTGTATIGDKVFEDIGNDGVFNAGTDAGIASVTVWLYEDTNGNGVIDAGVDALVATTTSNGNGNYSFTNLADRLQLPGQGGQDRPGHPDLLQHQVRSRPGALPAQHGGDDRLAEPGRHRPGQRLRLLAGAARPPSATRSSSTPTATTSSTRARRRWPA